MPKVLWVAETLNKPKRVTKKDMAILRLKKDAPKKKSIPKATLKNGMSHISEARINNYGKKKK